MLEKTVPEATVELLHGLLHLAENFAVLRAVHGAIDNDERSMALPAEAAPDHLDDIIACNFGIPVSSATLPIPFFQGSTNTPTPSLAQILAIHVEAA